MTVTRLHLCLAGLLGAIGVVLLAAGSHSGGELLTTAGQILLFHAPVIIAATVARKSGHLGVLTSQWGLALLILGSVIFAANLVLLHGFGARLFPFAAPSSGVMMILGWLVLAASAFFSKPDPVA